MKEKVNVHVRPICVHCTAYALKWWHFEFFFFEFFRKGEGGKLIITLHIFHCCSITIHSFLSYSHPHLVYSYNWSKASSDSFALFWLLFPGKFQHEIYLHVRYSIVLRVCVVSWLNIAILIISWSMFQWFSFRLVEFKQQFQS